MIGCIHSLQSQTSYLKTGTNSLGTPEQGVIVETAYTDEFVSLPAELIAARERLQPFVPDEHQLVEVGASLFNAPRYCLCRVTPFQKGEDEVNKCSLFFCASDYRTFLVTNGMDEVWAERAGLRDQWQSPEQWAKRWMSGNQGDNFFENSFGVNVLLTVPNDNGERVALFRVRGGNLPSDPGAP